MLVSFQAGFEKNDTGVENGNDFMQRFLLLSDFLTVVDRSLIAEGVEWIRLKKAKDLKGYNANKSVVKHFIDDYF